jgi:hypothetical protein
MVNLCKNYTPCTRVSIIYFSRFYIQKTIYFVGLFNNFYVKFENSDVLVY